MEIKAKLNFLRITPRKIRAIAEQLRGLSLAEAEAQLMIAKRKAAEPILKLLKSAVANAQNNFSLKKEDLLIKKFEVNEGPTLHRWFPRAFGRAAPIRKRSSHLLIVLGVKEGVKITKTEEKKKTKEEINLATTAPATDAHHQEGASKKSSDKKTGKEQVKSKSNKKGFAKKIFSRKAI
jgi:large subunit ribosomal protein L22